jgi:hypothetical protein
MQLTLATVGEVLGMYNLAWIILETSSEAKRQRSLAYARYSASITFGVLDEVNLSYNHQ